VKDNYFIANYLGVSFKKGVDLFIPPPVGVFKAFFSISMPSLSPPIPANIKCELFKDAQHKINKLLPDPSSTIFTDWASGDTSHTFPLATPSDKQIVDWMKVNLFQWGKDSLAIHADIVNPSKSFYTFEPTGSNPPQFVRVCHHGYQLHHDNALYGKVFDAAYNGHKAEIRIEFIFTIADSATCP